MSNGSEKLYVDVAAKVAVGNVQGARDLMNEAIINNRNRYVNTQDLNRTFRFIKEMIKLKDFNGVRVIFRRLCNTSPTSKSEATPIIYIIERASQWLLAEAQNESHIDMSAVPALSASKLTSCSKDSLREVQDSLSKNLKENGKENSRQRLNTARLLTDMHNRAVDHLRATPEMEPYVNFLNREYLRIVLGLEVYDDLNKFMVYELPKGKGRKADRHINIGWVLTPRWPGFGDMRTFITDLTHLRGFLYQQHWRGVHAVLKDISQHTAGFNPFTIVSLARRSQTLYAFALYYGSLADVYLHCRADKLRLFALLKQYACGVALFGHSVPAAVEIIRVLLQLPPETNETSICETIGSPTDSSIALTNSNGLPLLDPSYVDQTPLSEVLTLCSYLNLSHLPSISELKEQVKASDAWFVVHTALPSLAKQTSMILSGECVMQDSTDATNLISHVTEAGKNLQQTNLMASNLIEQALDDIEQKNNKIIALSPFAQELISYVLNDSVNEEVNDWNKKLDTMNEQELALATSVENLETYNEYHIVPAVIDITRTLRSESYSTGSDLILQAGSFTATWNIGVTSVISEPIYHNGSIVTRKISASWSYPLKWAKCQLLEPIFTEYNRGISRLHQPIDVLASPTEITPFKSGLLPLPRGLPTSISVTLDGIPTLASNNWAKCIIEPVKVYKDAASFCVQLANNYKILNPNHVHSFLRALGQKIPAIFLPSCLVDHGIPFRQLSSSKLEITKTYNVRTSTYLESQATDLSELMKEKLEQFRVLEKSPAVEKLHFLKESDETSIKDKYPAILTFTPEVINANMQFELMLQDTLDESPTTTQVNIGQSREQKIAEMKRRKRETKIVKQDISHMNIEQQANLISKCRELALNHNIIQKLWKPTMHTKLTKMNFLEVAKNLFSPVDLAEFPLRSLLFAFSKTSDFNNYMADNVVLYSQLNFDKKVDVSERLPNRESKAIIKPYTVPSGMRIVTPDESYCNIFTNTRSLNSYTASGYSVHYSRPSVPGNDYIAPYTIVSGFWKTLLSWLRLQFEATETPREKLPEWSTDRDILVEELSKVGLTIEDIVFQRLYWLKASNAQREAAHLYRRGAAQSEATKGIEMECSAQLLEMNAEKQKWMTYMQQRGFSCAGITNYNKLQKMYTKCRRIWLQHLHKSRTEFCNELLRAMYFRRIRYVDRFAFIVQEELTQKYNQLINELNLTPSLDSTAENLKKLRESLKDLSCLEDKENRRILKIAEGPCKEQNKVYLEPSPELVWEQLRSKVETTHLKTSLCQDLASAALAAEVLKNKSTLEIFLSELKSRGAYEVKLALEKTNSLERDMKQSQTRLELANKALMDKAKESVESQISSRVANIADTMGNVADNAHIYKITSMSNVTSKEKTEESTTTELPEITSTDSEFVVVDCVEATVITPRAPGDSELP